MCSKNRQGNCIVHKKTESKVSEFCSLYTSSIVHHTSQTHQHVLVITHTCTLAPWMDSIHTWCVCSAFLLSRTPYTTLDGNVQKWIWPYTSSTLYGAKNSWNIKKMVTNNSSILSLPKNNNKQNKTKQKTKKTKKKTRKITQRKLYYENNHLNFLKY